jgi:hypothetical protein
LIIFGVFFETPFFAVFRSVLRTEREACPRCRRQHNVVEEEEQVPAQ